ncbi:hypothetical protein P4126_33785 [Pseudomonas aeruginosa]|nr:hypothetical protein [Pseudomonas aeruginosa]
MRLSATELFNGAGACWVQPEG